MPPLVTGSRELLYQRLARDIERQISDGLLKAGDKILSIRELCRRENVSMSTAQLTYAELEKKSLIESRPQSGYYVARVPGNELAIPAVSRPVARTVSVSPEERFENSYYGESAAGVIYFSKGLPSPELLPVARLNKFLLQAIRELPGSGTTMDSRQGHEPLRRQLAKWSYTWKGNLSPTEIITTSGCMNAIAYGMMAVTKPGDTIAVESPCFYGILQLARELGLKVLELPTDAQTGVSPEVLKKTLSTKKISLVLLVSNFNNPLGSLMPEENKRETVRLLEKFNVPLIEDDLYGDLFFASTRPLCCKSFDESGLVLYCSSVSKTLSPGYRVGWIAPGKFFSKVSALKTGQTLSCAVLPQQVVASFLESGRYEQHLRQLRRTLYGNYLKYLGVIGESFPKGVRLSRPQGGLSLWLEFPGGITGMDIYHAAIKNKVSVSPGSLFTSQKQFDQCLRLAFGMPWTEKVENGLKLIGRLAKNAL